MTMPAFVDVASGSLLTCTRRHLAHLLVSLCIRPARETQALWSQNYVTTDALLIHLIAVIRVYLAYAYDTWGCLSSPTMDIEENKQTKQQKCTYRVAL